MRFTISLVELNKLLTKTQNVVSAKPPVPLLTNLLIEADSSMLRITATDLTVGIRAYSEAKVHEPGSCALPARKLTQLIRELNCPHVEIITNDQHTAEIRAGTSRFKLNGMSKDQYPALPSFEEATRFTIPQKELKEALFRTAFAVSREDNRYVLTGMFLHIAGGKATFVGTDGKRLAKNQLPITLEPHFQGQYIVPLKAVEEIMKNLEDSGTATLYMMQDKIAVEANSSILVTKLLSGDYPDINRIIPEKLDNHLSLHREELMTLLRQVSLFTTDSNQPVRFSFQGGELKLTSNAMEIGEGQVSMPVNYSGQRLDIAFNPGYFLDVLRHCTEETVDFGVIDAYNPVILREEVLDKTSGKQKAKENQLCLIMPMRLDPTP